MAQSCFICLKINLVLMNINETDSTNVKTIEKLKNCVPEVNWHEAVQICSYCSHQLENAYVFRELCIKSQVAKLEQKLEIYMVNKDISDTENDYKGFDASEPFECIVEESFICFHCEKEFTDKTKLASHIEEHNPKPVQHKNQHKCSKCSETFASKPKWKKHNVKCIGNIELKTVDENYLKPVDNEHNGKKDKTEPLNPSNVCSICDGMFNNKYLLKRHIKNVHATEKNFHCDLCNRSFASPVYLNAHKSYHSGERKHICSFCGKGYITASDLYHHEKIHANKRAYRCEKCGKAFNTSSDLHKHKICVHMDRLLWKYECSYCQRRFPLKTNLDTHIKTHTGEKNFACHLCERKCINRSVLMRHIESHSNVKSFKCQICLQGYKYQKSLDIHMTKSHGVGDAKVPERVKKYFCNICPKGYFANNKLQKHIRTHTGDRPYKCPSCDKCFIDKSYIKLHLKTSHGVTDDT